MKHKLAMKKVSVVLLMMIATCGAASAQAKKSLPADTVKTVAKDTSAKKRNLPKAVKEVITKDAITKKGLFTVHLVDDRWFFEIADSLIGRDILIVNRIAKSAVDNHPDDRANNAGMMGYAGDIINQNVIRLEKGPNYKIFFRSVSYSVNPKDSTKPMYQSVLNSNLQPIVGVLDIKALGKDSTSVIVDITDLLKKEDRLFTFGYNMKKELDISRYIEDRSYVLGVRSFPTNTEIRTVRTWERQIVNQEAIGVPKLGPPAIPTESYAVTTLELNSSIILLPNEPMRPRYYDGRVGFFATGYTDFDTDPQGVKNTYMVTRWRLEPKEEDLEKFKRGELVEPKKPIVYYIDPATPKQWVKYLIQGVNDWQKAFEKAGFKNAIIGKVAPTPEEDSTWSLEDARNSAIVYKPSAIPNASGPNVHDPRSGEILESHINWYHNVMKLSRNWYLVQAAPNDTAARHATFSEELMGQLIRFVSSHEVGHTLGLAHNMGASNATPVEKLRDKAWVEQHGHTASIMDYARFNYVAQPEDRIGTAGIFPRINDYDAWAIEWGYRPVADKTEEEEKAFLRNLVTERTKNPRLRFISGEEGLSDPRAQTEDLGDNAMKASTYGIKNLQFVLPRLEGWVETKGESYQSLRELYNEVITQYQRYMMHVLANIGGVYTDRKVSGQAGDAYQVTPKALQKEAFAFISNNALQKPEWLLNKNILDKIVSPEQEFTTKLGGFMLDQLFNSRRLSRLMTSTDRTSGASYRVEEYMEDIQQALWSELSTGAAINPYRRTLQNLYIAKVREFVSPINNPFEGLITLESSGPDLTKTDIPAISKALFRSLKAQLGAAIPKTSDKLSRMHLQYSLDLINLILNPKL